MRPTPARLLVTLPVNLGVGGALHCGFRYVVQHAYDRVVQCDGDGQHPPELIQDLLDVQGATGSQLVIGSRFLPGAQSFRLGFRGGSSCGGSRSSCGHDPAST